MAIIELNLRALNSDFQILIQKILTKFVLMTFVVIYNSTTSIKKYNEAVRSVFGDKESIYARSPSEFGKY